MLPSILLAQYIPDLSGNPPPVASDHTTGQVSARAYSLPPNYQPNAKGVWVFSNYSFTDSNNNQTIGNFANLPNPTDLRMDNFYLTEAQQTLPNGLNVTYRYDAYRALSDPKTIFSDANPAVSASITNNNITWNYNISGNTSTIASINLHDTDGSTDTWAYDEKGSLKSLTYTTSAQQTIQVNFDSGTMYSYTVGGITYPYHRDNPSYQDTLNKIAAINAKIIAPIPPETTSEGIFSKPKNDVINIQRGQISVTTPSTKKPFNYK